MAVAMILSILAAHATAIASQKYSAAGRMLEQPLSGTFVDQQQGAKRHNEKLLDLATGVAKGVPTVQQECLMQLLFGLSDDGGVQFLAITTDVGIPVKMRAEFLRESLAMRPTELGEWLSQQVSNHYETNISAVGRLYIPELKAAPR